MKDTAELVTDPGRAQFRALSAVSWMAAQTADDLKAGTDEGLDGLFAPSGERLSADERALVSHALKDIAKELHLRATLLWDANVEYLASVARRN